MKWTCCMHEFDLLHSCMQWLGYFLSVYVLTSTVLLLKTLQMLVACMHSTCCMHMCNGLGIPCLHVCLQAQFCYCRCCACLGTAILVQRWWQNWVTKWCETAPPNLQDFPIFHAAVVDNNCSTIQLILSISKMLCVFVNILYAMGYVSQQFPIPL